MSTFYMCNEAIVEENIEQTMVLFVFEELREIYAYHGLLPQSKGRVHRNVRICKM